MDRTLEQRTIGKVYRRLLPFTALCYFICYLDRINVGFAALTMNKDLGLSASDFGLAAGAFFWGYVLFEVPSNVILEKVGARIWIARIMITWGLLSGATAFATGPWSFATLRFLLGVAEAGFFPGMILFFTYWFPAAHRARIVAGFTVALPIAVALGSPTSTALLELNGILGLHGWQWMFIGEATPSVLLGIVVLVYLTDKPAKAHWLAADERAWLGAELDRERREIEAARKYTLLEALRNPQVLLLALNYFGIVTASLGLVIFAPQIIKQLGLTNMQTGFATAVPYIFGVIGMLSWGWFSDRTQERRWNLAAACAVSTIGLIGAGLLQGSFWSLAMLSVAAFGFYGTKGPFWSLPSTFLSGTAAAGAIAWINSLGNLGGSVGPFVVGRLKDLTGDFASGLYGLAAFAFLALLVSVFGVRSPRRKRAAAALQPAE
jgi:ACS family tartrate transporter-like MFS transporter